VLSDSNNDGVLGEGDWWELHADEDGSSSGGSRKVGDFHWLGETAYVLEVDDASGLQCRLVSFDPGLTREQDELARDVFAADRMAVKAATPLKFRHDADDALAAAASQQVPCFIKFETTWCGPCRMMTDMVFTAKDVVDAAEGVICVKVDGDERKDLVERYSVNGYPTGVVLAPDGTEASRFVGYQSVAQMTAFLLENGPQRAK